MERVVWLLCGCSVCVYLIELPYVQSMCVSLGYNCWFRWCVAAELHAQFLEFFEEKLQKFLDAEGLSGTAFYRELRDAERRDRDSKGAKFGQDILAALDFTVFVNLMKELQRQRRHSKK